MKKIIVIFLFMASSIAVFTGCTKTMVENKTIGNTSDGNKTDSKDVVIDEPEDNNNDIPDFNQEVITNNNKNTFTSTIAVEDDLAMQSYQVDQQIQQELQNNEYLFENPLTILDPFGNSPLTAVILFRTEEACAVRVIVKGNTNKTDVVGYVNATKLHRIPVIGLYPDRMNEVIIQKLDQDETVTAEKTIMIQTDPLPSSMEDVVRVEKTMKPSAYGLIEVSGFGTPYPFAFDTEGCIRWYLSKKYASYGYFPISNNHFFVMGADAMTQTYEKPHAQQLYEMDYLGRVYQIYMVENGAHHEIIEKIPGGNLLVLTNSIDEHVEDMVQEIDRETGEVVKSLDMREIFGDTYVNMMDWAHLNTVSYLQDSDCVLLSVRNLHSTIKVNWSTNELLWILGNPEFWEKTSFENKVLQPVGDIIWNYQQHSTYEIAQDLDNNPDTIHIMMFDNHWDKSRKVDFFDDSDLSYVSLFAINEDAMNVTQSHTYEGIKSKITSNFTFDYETGRVFSMGGYLAEETKDGKNGMIYEYDYASEEVINQYSLRYTFYRAYEFNPDFDACAEPLSLTKNYFKGTLKAAAIHNKVKSLPTKTLKEGVTFRIVQQLLYIKAGDHMISKVEFIGNNTSYILDLSYTKGGEEKYKKLVYNILVPFSNLKPDEYQLVVTYDGVRYNTNETIIMK